MEKWCVKCVKGRAGTSSAVIHLYSGGRATGTSQGRRKSTVGFTVVRVKLHRRDVEAVGAGDRR